MLSAIGGFRVERSWPAGDTEPFRTRDGRELRFADRADDAGGSPPTSHPRAAPLQSDHAPALGETRRSRIASSAAILVALAGLETAPSPFHPPISQRQMALMPWSSFCADDQREINAMDAPADRPRRLPMRAWRVEAHRLRAREQIGRVDLLFARDAPIDVPAARCRWREPTSRACGLHRASARRSRSAIGRVSATPAQRNNWYWLSVALCSWKLRSVSRRGDRN